MAGKSPVKQLDLTFCKQYRGGKHGSDICFRSALFNICRKALGHLMKFTQRSIPCRLSTAFYRLGLSTAFTD